LNIVTCRFDNLSSILRHYVCFLRQFLMPSSNAILTTVLSFCSLTNDYCSHSFLPPKKGQRGKNHNYLPYCASATNCSLSSMTGSSSTSAAPSYKQLKEDFVSHLSGGSVSEIAQVCAVAPVCIQFEIRQSWRKKVVTSPKLTKNASLHRQYRSFGPSSNPDNPSSSHTPH